MYKEISNESYERVQSAIEDIGYCCATEDDYTEWEDIAASSIGAFIEALNDVQLEMTCAAFREYINETAETDLNMAMGVKTALARAIREMLETIDFEAPVIDEDDEDEEYEADTDTADVAAILKKELEIVENMSVEE